MTKDSFIVSLDEVKAGPELPFANQEHCMVKIDESTFAMIGGPNAIKGLHFYSRTTGLWSTGPDMLFAHKSKFGCAIFEVHGSKAIAIVGGNTGNNGNSKVVEFFKLDSMTWERGPDLDRGLKEFALAVDKSGRILYAIGGVSSGSPSRGMVRVLDCSEGTCPATWTKYADKVSDGGGFINGGHVMVPDFFRDHKCS